ncbi:hypothetical protein RRG08_067037 [Elysia crispata]|uniref:Uncharacterized protein n=1 Tax=Elysia crispata TaxID=231223 RepID=A0AAE1A076_9GAST|nr:hypothetical protein RRG08_067037 [Elysia crispata]
MEQQLKQLLSSNIQKTIPDRCNKVSGVPQNGKDLGQHAAQLTFSGFLCTKLGNHVNGLDDNDSQSINGDGHSGACVGVSRNVDEYDDDWM